MTKESDQEKFIHSHPLVMIVYAIFGIVGGFFGFDLIGGFEGIAGGSILGIFPAILIGNAIGK